MDRELILDAKQLNKQRQRKKLWQRAVSILGCIVVFCTTYALILPAITQEREAFCGMEEHTHGESCYSQITQKQLICTPEALGLHTHGTECYDAEGSLSCNQADFVVHTHNEVCYDREGTCVCALPELGAHVHGEVCYSLQGGHSHGEGCYAVSRGELICQEAEEPGHTHGPDCYIPGEALLCTQQENHFHGEACYATGTLLCTWEENHVHGEGCTGSVLKCTLPQDESHTHEDTCYETQIICENPEEHTHGADCYEKLTVCTIPEGHTHGDSCYEQVLQCQTPEAPGHTHGDGCYEQLRELTCILEEVPGQKLLTCTQPEAQVHVHGEACFRTAEAPLTCTVEEGEDHAHSAMCYGTWELVCTLEEHTHSLICYSDPEADLETAEDWEKTFADAELTGRWAEDVLTIAESQLGYQESTSNYIVEEGEALKGYTRYGAWYGIPYGDWCAMYASFCLHYAGVEGIPAEASVSRWIALLSEAEYDLYRPAGAYVPQPGDLVFFDWEQDGDPDHVGFVAELLEATQTEPLKIKTIEGNSGNTVRHVTYEMSDPDILGFGALPYQLTEKDWEAVNGVIALIDAMPSADDIDAKMLEYEEAEDYEGLETWYTGAVQQVCDTYLSYSYLTDYQKTKVTNADKLLELEYIWSVHVLIDKITSDKPTTNVVSENTSDFIELNLYDYGSNINTNYNRNKEYPGFQWNGGAYVTYNKSGNATYSYTKVDCIDFGNSLITDRRNYASSNKNGVNSYRWIIGNQGGDINALDNSEYGLTNRPIGMSLGKNVLLPTLRNGYPALPDGTSLDYLFKNGTYANKQNTASIDGLFQKNEETGEYFYSSFKNHAQYENNKFTLYDQLITPNFILYSFGNFLPFNEIDNLSNSTQVSKITSIGNYVQNVINDMWYDSSLRNQSTGDWYDPTAGQLVDMLAKYRDTLKEKDVTGGNAWDRWSAEDVVRDFFANTDDLEDAPANGLPSSLFKKLYNIDWDVETNFFFGMEMKMNFMQPKGGMTGNDTNKDGAADYPMVFEFSGDDDVWVYIDDVLFLDLSGIHRHVGGTIDFVNGKVHYYHLDLSGVMNDQQTEKSYKTFTFKELLEAAGKDTSVLNEKGTFKDYTTHKFNFYYMERGSGSSVCQINFNFPLLRQNAITIEKALTADSDVAALGNPSYPFQVLAASASGTKTDNLFVAAGTPYTLYDVDGTVIQEVKLTKNPDGSIASTYVVDASGKTIEDSKILKTDANGILWLKAGQRAEFVGINENAGKYYVRELLDEVTLPQYGQITVSGSSTTKVENVTVGGVSFTGADSPVTDMSAGATLFRFTNKITTTKLSSLSISKKLTEYDTARDPINYDIEVTLDGVLLPVGTEYTVGTETRNVETAGIITINQNETAVISKILAGSQFTVQETSGSAEGYVVTYLYEGGDSVSVQEGKVVGKLKTEAVVKITIDNAEKGTTVIIPGTKSMSQYDGAEHSYTVRLTQVRDHTGITPVEGVPEFTKPIAVTDSLGAFSFELKYVLVDLNELPKVLYYRITEDAPTDGVTLPNSTVYVAEVTITEDGSGGISAAVTNLWKGISGADGPEELTKCSAISADFENTLIGDLTVSKTVDGDTAAKNTEYTFTLTVTSGDSGVPVDGAYTVILTDSTGQQTTQTITLQAGVPKPFSMKHNESLRVCGLPYGAVWTVEETAEGAFKVTNTVTAGQTAVPGEGKVTTGTVVTGGTTVAYTNTILYLLPETGGAGTTLYTMAGLALMGSALCLKYIPSKRRKGGKSS